MTSEIRARTLDWGTGWASVPDGGALQRELDRELAAQHPLSTTKPVVFGRCLACDDVVVHLTYPADGPELAVVHLTWPGRAERSLRTVLRGRISNGSPLIASSLGSSVEVSIVRIRVLASGPPGPHVGADGPPTGEPRQQAASGPPLDARSLARTMRSRHVQRTMAKAGLEQRSGQDGSPRREGGRIHFG